MDEKTIARFWAKVDKRGPDECWLWTATRVWGYGSFKDGARLTVKAHRFSWVLANGPIPPGSHWGTTCVCHRCDTKACVNPSHLFLGTQTDNMRDMDAKGRRAPTSGGANGNARLTPADVIAIRADRAAGMAYSQIGARHGITAEQASNIARGKSWAHLR